MEYDVENLANKTNIKTIKELKKLSGKNIMNFKQPPATSIILLVFLLVNVPCLCIRLFRKNIENFNEKLKCSSMF